MMNEEAARLLAKADNKSELIKYLLERYALQKSKGGGDGGQAARAR
ncbi:MAG: hypothetical protein DDT21_00108 [Syntrophomonadaceae bacterium]|nr:hypothetical protein [Bacillota bacterium]